MTGQTSTMPLETSIFEVQLVARHVGAHDTVERRNQMRDTIKFNTGGERKTDEPAKLGADLDKASRADWLSSEILLERDEVQKSVGYAVHFHDGDGESWDTQPF